MIYLITPGSSIGLTISEIDDNCITFSNNGIMPTPHCHTHGTLLNAAVSKVTLDYFINSNKVRFTLFTNENGYLFFEMHKGINPNPFAVDILYSIN
jgi:hypothetical protein